MNLFMPFTFQKAIHNQLALCFFFNSLSHSFFLFPSSEFCRLEEVGLSISLQTCASQKEKTKMGKYGSDQGTFTAPERSILCQTLKTNCDNQRDKTELPRINLRLEQM